MPDTDATRLPRQSDSIGGADGGSDSRAAFAARLSALFAAAGAPTVKSVIRAANTRIRPGCTPITAQRISDWRHWHRIPATFESILPVLEVLIGQTRARPPDPRLDPALLDMRRWHADWQSSRAVQEPRADTGRAPYRGLAAYRPEDADLFFGRAAAAAGLWELIDQAESAPGPGLVLVDRGEFLFARCAAEVADGFFNRLVELTAPEAEPRTTVVLACDSAYLTDLANHPALAPLSNPTLLLEPMSDAEMREAITRPAAATGLKIEDSLIEVLLRELSSFAPHSPIRLPMLSYVLATTWENRRGTTLTLDACRESGGVAGAVAKGCETLWSLMSDRDRAAARTVLVNLVFLGPTAAQRNRLSPEVLIREAEDPEATAAVIAWLTKVRIVVRHRDEIELVHDGLLTAWPRMAEWLAEERQFTAVRPRIEADAREWAAHGRPPRLLYRRTRLEDALTWLRRTDTSNRVAREFLSESTIRQRRRMLRKRLLQAGIAALVAIALVLALAVFTGRVTVTQERRGAWLGEIISESQRLQEIDPGLSVQLALAGYRMNEQSPTARSRLLAAQSLPVNVTSAVTHAGPVAGLALSPGRRLAASAGTDATVRLWDLSDTRSIGALGEPLSGHRDSVSAVAFDPAGETLVSGGEDGVVQVWDVRDPRAAVRAGSVDIGAPVTRLTYLGDGRTVVAATDDGGLSTLDTTVPQSIRKVDAIAAHSGSVRALALGPDTADLASGSEDGVVRLWTADGGRLTPSGAPLTVPGALTALALGSDHLLAAGTADGLLQVWDARDPQRPRLIASEHARRVPITGLAFSRRGQVLVAAGSDGALRFWDTHDHERVLPTGWHAQGSGGSAESVAALSDNELVTAGSDGTISTWTASMVHVPIVFDGALTDAGLDRDGRLLASGLRDGRVALWDVTDPQQGRRLGEFTAAPTDSGGIRLAVRPDGRHAGDRR
ncbi:WD40 repeat domain-containing protein [Nocardia crassostreae]|uniref:WD40 repeat domain-containing protein n=1 Tax=Nocardia crassostreae TaxID=53428 RepID=UPI00082FFC63|nr:WD40 repeat domain-containing protein [Nocardia crassostreae]